MGIKREVILPSDLSEEAGKIICYRLSSYLELLYVDIKSRRIPEVQIQAYEGEPVMTVNYSFLGKCEVLLRNGGGTYVDTGEYSIDYGTASREADAFYYPRAQYYGLELILYPCRELDKELSLNGKNTKMSVELKERFYGRETPFISRADTRIEQAARLIADDIEAEADVELLTVDVSRWLRVLCAKKDAVETNRIYYSGSQIQIARKTMDILTEDLSKRYSAATLAKHFGISETSLKNYFRGVYGRGYSELLNEIRMKKAAELILQNTRKISEISDAVGFATQSRFAKAFKNYYGVAPLEYKRKYNLKKDRESIELFENE